MMSNLTEFNLKMERFQAVCQRTGLDTGDRLEINARKVKYLVRTLPNDSVFPPFEDFDVIHDYMQTNSRKTQARLRKRGQNGKFNPNSDTVGPLFLTKRKSRTQESCMRLTVQNFWIEAIEKWKYSNFNTNYSF